MGRYAIIDSGTSLVVTVVMWDGTVESGWGPPEGHVAIELPDGSIVGIGWSYINEQFIAPPEPEVPPPTDAEIIAANTSKLQQYTYLAAAQKTALTNRIGVLNDAIELEMATPEEIAELPVRQAQLLEWKRYGVFLGRVTLQAGWALTVEWPAQPTAGMDLTVSAVAPAPSQTS